jgi:hypothetical protein
MIPVITLQDVMGFVSTNAQSGEMPMLVAHADCQPFL